VVGWNPNVGKGAFVARAGKRDPTILLERKHTSVTSLLCFQEPSLATEDWMEARKPLYIVQHFTIAQSK
jgi:hypothetical protein